MTTTFIKQQDKIPLIDKAPLAHLDYSEDWTAWLAPGETITTASWVVARGMELAEMSHTDKITTAWLTGGKIGTTYLVSCTITTNQSREDTRSFRVRVTQR
jgi:hypothetical protein